MNTLTLPAPVRLGRPESYYSTIARRAKAEGDIFVHASAKVGQYLTLASHRLLKWDQKLKYYQHALTRHCTPPPWPDDETWMFYQGLADAVRRHAGAQALRIASREDDAYAMRLDLGEDREAICDDAAGFFLSMIPEPGKCPAWFSEEDYRSLMVLWGHWR
jgi:hypothetical protein